MVMAGDDVLGDGVNVASRLQEISADGSITISGRVYEDVKNKARINTRLIGERELKNVEEPVKVYEVLCEGEVEKEITFNQEPKKSRRKLLYYAIGGLVMVILVILIWQYMPTDETGSSSPENIVIEEISIAVLPFDNISGDPNQEPMCDGLTEEIIHHLSIIKDFNKVISRNSSMTFKNTEKTTPEIAALLSVGYILEGSYRESGDRLRITAQLIEASTDKHLWSEVYDRPRGDIFDIQSDIAQNVATELKRILTPEEVEKISKKPTENLEAYYLYRQGLNHYYIHIEPEFWISIEYFGRVIELDPQFTMAYVMIAQCYQYIARYSLISREEVKLKAKEAILKAMELDPNLGEIYSTLGLIKIVFDWDIYGPEQEFQKAIKLNPGSIEVCESYAEYLRWLGRYDESISLAKRALELDPQTPMRYNWLAIFYCFAGRYEESIQALEKTLKLDPDNIRAFQWLAINYTLLGMHDNAIEYADKIMSMAQVKDDPVFLAGVASLYANAGKEELARKQLDQLNELSKGQFIDPILFAYIYTGLGEKEEAFKYIAKGIDERSGRVIYLKAYADLFFIDLRSDPRYDELLRKVGFQVE
jgi:TolB-like protein/Tfp pilus assembly protein PilF